MINKSNILDDKMLKYNDLDYTASKVKVEDYVSNKNDKVHKELYESALDRYITYICDGEGVDEYKNSHIFIEIRQNNYWDPSYVYIKDINPPVPGTVPFVTEKVDLSPWWNDYQFVNDNKEIDKMFFNEDFNTYALSVVELDYINGRVKFRDKHNNTEFWKDFGFINSYTYYNTDEVGLNDTFSYKINNKIYGR